MIVFKNEEEYRQYESDTSKTEWDKVLESQHYFYIKYLDIKGKDIASKIRDGYILDFIYDNNRRERIVKL